MPATRRGGSRGGRGRGGGRGGARGRGRGSFSSRGRDTGSKGHKEVHAPGIHKDGLLQTKKTSRGGVLSRGRGRGRGGSYHGERIGIAAHKTPEKPAKPPKDPEQEAEEQRKAILEKEKLRLERLKKQRNRNLGVNHSVW